MSRNSPVRLVLLLAIVVALVFISRNLYHHYANRALGAAVKRKDVSTVRWLLDHGADPNYQFRDTTPNGIPLPPQPMLNLAFSKLGEDPSRVGASYSALPDKRAEKIFILLISHGAHLQEGHFLAEACRIGDITLTREMLDHGASPQSPENADALNAALSYATSFHTAVSSEGRFSMARTPQEKAEVAHRQEVSRQLVQLLRDHGARLSLVEAQAIGDMATIQKLLVSGGTDSQQDKYITLSQAAKTGDMATLNLLIQHGVDPRFTPHMTNTPEYILFGYKPPLNAAIAGNHIEAVKLLLAHGADPNAQSIYSEPALGEAADAGNLDMVKLLLSHGAKVNVPGRFSPLMKAIYAKRADIVRYLLAANAKPTSSPTGLLPLTAALQVLPEVVPDLLKHGAAVNSPPDPNTLQYGNQYHGVTEIPSSPLLAAVWYAPQYESTLVKAGAKIGSDRSVACVTAAWQKRMNLLPKLLAYGADINGADATHGTAITVCVQNDPQAVKTLLEHGANPNVQARDKRTPLEEAVMLGNTELVRLLLAHKADVNMGGGRGDTPLYWARKKNHPDIVTLLQQAGAKE